ITTGDLAGWTDPSLRFKYVAVGNQLDGFGIPPVPCKNDTTEITEIICFGESFSFKQQELTVAGTYLDTLAKNDGCNTDSIVMLNLQINPQITPSAIATDVSCNGGTDGSIDLSVTGGTSPYSFVWDDSNNSTSE